VSLLKKIMVFIMTVSSSALAEPMRVTGIDSVQANVRWQVVNDTVMGGRSESRFIYENGQLQFSGRLNTNGGGFASLRSNRQDWDLSEFSVVRLKVRGDGRNYRFRLYVDNDRASYQSDFATAAGEWEVIELPIDEFQASWRGRRLSRPPLAASKISGVGLILADGIDGTFDLALDWIEFGHVLTAQQPESSEEGPQ
jgi:hypothetical protein